MFQDFSNSVFFFSRVDEMAREIAYVISDYCMVFYGEWIYNGWVGGRSFRLTSCIVDCLRWVMTAAAKFLLSMEARFFCGCCRYICLWSSHRGSAGGRPNFNLIEYTCLACKFWEDFNHHQFYPHYDDNTHFVLSRLTNRHIFEYLACVVALFCTLLDTSWHHYVTSLKRL